MSSDRELSEYEAQRLAHMKRNHEYLVMLGLKAADDPIAPNAPKKRKTTTTTKARSPRLPVLPESLRRSARLKGQAAEFGGEVVDALGEDEDVTTSKTRELTDMRREAMAYLESVREAVLPVAVESDAADEWRREAVRRWGPKAGAGKAQRDWKCYVQSRLSTPPPVSPLDFLQEMYAADTWRLLVCCVLMSRVSSWHTKHDCISAFFERYPTPSAFVDETNWENVKTAIHSLGLFDDRLKSLVALTDRFLNGPANSDDDDMDDFQLSTDRASPHKVHGLGPFGVESYLVFCKDLGATIKLSAGGKPIEPFVKWRKANPN